MHACMNIRMHAHTHICMHAHFIYACMPIWMHAHMHTCSHTHMRTCMQAYARLTAHGNHAAGLGKSGDLRQLEPGGRLRQM